MTPAQKILIVDDAPETLSLLKHYFRKTDYELELARNLVEARVCFEQSPPQLILLDIELPDGNGLDWAAELRKDYTRTEMPIIILSSHDSSRYVASGLQTGANDYIRKPVAEAELLARVESQLNLSRTSLKLQESEARFRRIANSVQDTIYRIEFQDQKPLLRFISGAVQTLTGYSPEEVIENPDCITNLNFDNWDHYVSRLQSPIPVISRWLVSDDRIVWVENRPTPIEDKSGDLIAIEGVIRDITRLRAFDSLTGLPNLDLLSDSLNQKLSRTDQNENGALIIINLNRFRLVTQSLGYNNSQQLLQLASRRLSSKINAGSMLARIGESRFAVLNFVENDENVLLDYARDLQTSLNAPFQLAEHTTYANASVGIVQLFKDQLQNADEVLKAGESALYAARHTSGNPPVLFKPDLEISASNLLKLDHDIRQAIINKEFLLYGQPIYSATGGEICKVELLLRWLHPDQGLIGPGEFIPYLEESGLIIEVGEWIMHETCRWLDQLNGQLQDDFVFTVNFSSRQLEEPNIVDRLQEILDSHGTDPGRIEIEITESMVLGAGKGQNLLTLEGIREMGLQLALDDFGTGYSSLSYLKYFPVNTLKIDRSFLHNIEIQDKNLAILKAIINLAHELNLKVVTEGVETIEQLELLRKLDCEYAQGFYLSKPVPGPELLQLLQSNQESHQKK